MPSDSLLPIWRAFSLVGNDRVVFQAIRDGSFALFVENISPELDLIQLDQALWPAATYPIEALTREDFFSRNPSSLSERYKTSTTDAVLYVAVKSANLDCA